MFAFCPFPPVAACAPVETLLDPPFPPVLPFPPTEVILHAETVKEFALIKETVVVPPVPPTPPEPGP